MNLKSATSYLTQWVRRDPKLAGAVGVLALLLVLAQVVRLVLPEGPGPSSGSSMQETQAKSLVSGPLIPQVNTADAARLEAEVSPPPAKMATAVTEHASRTGDSAFAHHVAASMLVMFNEKYNKYVIDLCTNAGVEMPRYEAAAQRAYGASLANAKKILGNNTVLLEGFMSLGGREEGLRQMGTELDATPGYDGDRARVCKEYERNPERAIAAKHFKKAQPQAFQLLATAPGA